MATITEAQEPKQPQQPQKPKLPKPHKQTQNPFTFWFYCTLTVSLFTLIFISLSSLIYPHDPKSWFLSLPSSLRHHYSHGRTIKTQLQTTPIEVFTIESNPLAPEKVVLIHGLGLNSFSFREIIKLLGSKGVHVIAFDLPGNGFSDKSTVEIEAGNSGGVLGKFFEVYGLIQEKGLFWAFDQMVETGQIPYEEIEKNRNRISKRGIVKAIELGSEEIGRVLGQVIETMKLAPVHLVLHDTALLMCANWVFENPGVIRSVTLIDTGRKPALPLWVLEVPVIREVVLGFSFVYERLIRLCCSKGIGSSDSEAHRVILKGRDGRRAVLGMGRKLNYSFDVSEWGGLDGVKHVPMQVLWSSGWSKEWSEEGYRIAGALPQAKYITHSGGRWPQEDAANEIAENIYQFVTSLPKSLRQDEEEPVPEHIQKMFDEAKDSDHHHHHAHGGHDDHAHAHAAGYMNAYGLGHGWGS
ncbi:Abhydrolase_6 domain-containing protein [Cephalotus follicularis]|uniref:Abhydrolase_6 domain-containing protein n=1 Tax=Cephalotus follicularis TaxID=3775 RepID=A0A1Q3B573_CEPFO|nr:Abhydrolase_6 domain-containing protein [Cephalotus follicularis]